MALIRCQKALEAVKAEGDIQIGVDIGETPNPNPRYSLKNLLDTQFLPLVFFPRERPVLVDCL